MSNQNELNTDKKFDYKIGPSLLKKAIECPGIVTLDVDRDESLGNPYTRSGTLAHAWLEEFINNDRVSADIKIKDFIKDIKFPEDEEQFSDPVGSIISSCHDFALDIIDQFDFTITNFTAELKMGYEYIFKESGSDNTFVVRISGTADLVFVNEDSVTIVDWKYYSDPSYLDHPRENLQLQAYLIMACKKFNKRSGTAIVGLIKQRKFISYSFSEEEIKLAYQNIRNIASNVIDGEFNYGSACQSCFFTNKCPVFIDKASRFLDKYVEDVTSENALEAALGIKQLKDRLK